MMMKTKKPKRTYEKPTMQVYELREQKGILTASLPDYEPEEW